MRKGAADSHDFSGRHAGGPQALEGIWRRSGEPGALGWAVRCAVLVLSALVLATGCSSGSQGSAAERSLGHYELPLTSDDFSSSTLNPAWTFVDPRGDSSYALLGAGSGDASVQISVPAGVDHDPWSTNNAARLMQSIENIDFEVEARFESSVTQRYQLQGILIEQDTDDYLRFDFYHDGSNVKFFAASFASGSPSIKVNTTIGSSTPPYLRVKRVGDVWTAFSSPDGQNWVQRTSFTHSLAVTSAGVMAGNDGPNPAHTAVVDYFFNTAAPISPEDPEGCEGGPFDLTVTPVGSGAVELSAPGPFDCGESVTLTANAAADHVFDGWGGDLSGALNPQTIEMTSDRSVTAHFSPIVATGDPISDDFSTGTLNGSLWSFVDPRGNSSYSLTGAGTEDALLEIAVPAGTEHDPWQTNNAARMMQEIGDVDFTVETKFQSPVNQRYQLQGILVEQANGNFVRFDIHFDGSSTRFFSATRTNGSMSVKKNAGVSAATSHLRVTRSGTSWTAFHSTNGESWTQGVSFNHSFEAAKIGVMAGNAGNNPAHTAKFDYFFNTAAPLDPEDPASCAGGPFEIDVQALGSGSGSVNLSSAGPYDCNESVTLTAVPDADNEFVGWGGELSGSENPQTVVVRSDLAVTAEFAPAADPCPGGPFNVDIQTVGTGSGSVNLSSAGPYDCGETVTLTAVPDADNEFVGWGGDGSGTANPLELLVQADLSVTAEFEAVTPPDPGQEPVSDDFHTGTLDTSLWDFVDPVGNSSYDVVGGGTPDALLEISVPAGSAHDAWQQNNAARVMQAIGDVDFTVETKFQSSVNARYQLQGIVTEQANGDFIRFDIYSDGSSTRFFAATGTNGSMSTKRNTIVPASTAYLRVMRSDSSWTAWYSSDGSSWTHATSFTHSFAPNAVGVMAGNAGPNPAHTARVDYFFNTAAPISPEDPIACTGGPFTIDVAIVGEAGTVTPSEPGPYACGESVTLTAVPESGNTFVGWGGDLVGSENPQTLVVTSDLDVTAEFTAATTGAPVSDDFHDGTLNPMWTFVDPVGNSSFSFAGAGTSDAVLQLSVPAGSEHDPWQPNTAARMMQGIGNVDFSVETKFQSGPTQKYQIQGILVEEDADSFIRFDTYSDGSSLRFFSAVGHNGSMSVKTNQGVPSNTRYLRVERSGTSWTAWYSADGQNWTQAVSFASSTTVGAVGVMVGNDGNNPAYTAIVDYFFNSAAPISPEDPIGCSEPGPFVLNVAIQGNGTVDVDLPGPYSCGEIVNLTATPDPGNSFEGFSGDMTGTANPGNVVMTADRSVTATFSPPSIVLWYGDYQSFGGLGEPQFAANILGKVVGGAVSSLSFSLNGGPAELTSTSPSQNVRIGREGDFNATVDFADLNPGENTLTLVATYVDSFQVIKDVTIAYTPGNVWPLPYAIDFSDPGLSSIADAAQVVDGFWILEALGVRSAEPAYDRLIALGDESWTEYETVAEMTVHDVVHTSNPAGFGLGARWPGHHGGGSPPFAWYPQGCIGMYRYKSPARFDMFDPDGQVRNAASAPVVVPDTPYMMKLRIESRPGNTVWCGFRMWLKSEAEPTTWVVESNSGSTVAPPGGSALLIAHYVDATFANVSVTPLP